MPPSDKSAALGLLMARLRARRVRSLSDVARAIGCGISHVSLMEHGQRVPSWERLMLWLETLGASGAERHEAVVLWLATHRGLQVPGLSQEQRHRVAAVCLEDARAGAGPP